MSIDTALGRYETNEERDKPILDFVQDNKAAFKKQLDSWMGEIFDNHYYWLTENAPCHINDEAVKKAKSLISAVLGGDEEAAKALFQCGDSTRYKSFGDDTGKPWARVVNGKMRLTTEQELRQALVEQHADLLRTEVVKDLESQVAGLIKQLEEANKRLENAGHLAVEW